MKELKIDTELRDLLPPLTDDEYKQLEKNIIENGFDNNFPIMEWNGFIVDGHNRYSICKKHNIDFVYGTLGYKKKEEVMEWMLDIQLGRRNLSPIQRISVAEKYRPIYEKQARENSLNNLKQNSDNGNFIGKNDKIGRTSDILASIAGVSEKTYRMGVRVLNSNDEDLKKRVLSGETSVSAGYKEIINKNKRNSKRNVENNNTLTLPLSKTNPKISEEVKQICADLKTEKTKEYLDSIWDYKISVIHCMNEDFKLFYDGFVSILQDMENRVTKNELDICIKNAENMVDKMLIAIEETKNIKLKKEYKIMQIEDLENMLCYQTPIDINFVEEKSKFGVFDVNMLECPKISIRNDGTRKIIDGKHTIKIAKCVGWKLIRCELRYGLTIEEENDWYIKENMKDATKNHKKVLTNQIQGTYEKNKDEQDFYICLKSLGYKLNIYGEEKGNDFKIKCTASLLSLYKEYVKNNKKEKFIECLDIHKVCFDGNPISLQWNFLKGMFDFYETYNGEFDIKRLINILSNLEISSIKKEAENDIYTDKPSLKYAKVFVSKYNYKLVKNKRLKISKLED